MKKVTSHRTHANTGDAIRAISGRSDAVSPHINNLFDIPIDFFELLDEDDNRFRKDLLFRLNVIRLHLPPLCDRQGDNQLLPDHFFNTLSAQLGKKVRSFALGIKKFADLQLSGKRPRTEKCY